MDLPELPGRVRLRRAIGSGAFSTVWLGRDPELDCDVAVKILADNWARRTDVRERFLAEGRLLRRVDSDHLVRVYDVGTLGDGRPFLVMTYAAGGSLTTQLANGPLSTEHARTVLLAVASGLQILHRAGIVHRDLNPNNILRRTDDPSSPVLLADLGLAKDVAVASGLTQPTGTGIYRAPEQIDYSDEIGAATDVYAYAVLADQLVAGRGPAELTEVLVRARALDPDERPSLAEVVAVVAAWLPASDEADGGEAAYGRVVGATEPVVHTLSLPAQAGPPARPPRQSRPALVGAAAAATVVAAAGAWVVVRGSGAQRVEDPRRVASVALPRDWRALGTVAPPAIGVPAGASEASSGLVVESPDRSGRVSVAWVRQGRDTAAQAAAVGHGGCRAGSPVAARVAGLEGHRVDWSECADGAVWTELAVGSPAVTVWVQVRSAGGEPEVGKVLESVRLVGFPGASS